MSFLRVGAVLCVGLLVSACAGSQATRSTSAAQPVSAQATGTAAAMNVRVSNTIVRVGEVPNEDLLRAELEEFKSGLYWSRGARPTEALINIDGKVGLASEVGQENIDPDLGRSILFGDVSLIDVETGDVVVGPIRISVEVGSNRDAVVGLAERTKSSVELEYLVQKFILAGREALYGKGV
ncbi:MAG: hypothetical protein ACPGFA_10600 [Pikeienuella sp.]